MPRKTVAPETRERIAAAMRGERNPSYRPLSERIREKTRLDPKTGCIIWIGTASRGYGMIRRPSGEKTQAHRAAYELRHGELPEGALHHVCRNPLCTNPAHLLPMPSVADHRAMHRAEDEIVAAIESGAWLDELAGVTDDEEASRDELDTRSRAQLAGASASR